MFKVTKFNRRTTARFLASVLLACVGSVLMGAEIGSDDNAKETVRAWVAAHHAEAIERLMPAPNPEEALDLGIAWTATIRITPTDADSDEIHIWISKQYDGSVKARVTRPVGGSVQSQMAQIRSGHPGLSSEEVISLVRVRSVDISSSHGRQLIRMASDLQRTRGHYVFPNELVLDPTRYEFWALGGSQQVYITLAASDEGGSRPLLNVIAKLRTVAESATRSGLSKHSANNR